MMFLCWFDAIVLSDGCSDAWNATVARNVEERVGTDFEYRRRVGSEPRAAELALDDVRPAAGRTGRYRSGGHGRFPSRGRRRSTTVIRSAIPA